MYTYFWCNVVSGADLIHGEIHVKKKQTLLFCCSFSLKLNDTKRLQLIL